MTAWSLFNALPGLYCSTCQCCLFVGLSVWSLVFNKWNACSVGLRLGDTLGHSRIFHFFALINWVALALCFGPLSICIVKRPITFGHLAGSEQPVKHPINFGHLAGSEESVCLWTPQNSSGYFCPVSHHQWTLVNTFSKPFFWHHSGRGWSWFHLFLRLKSGFHCAVNPLYLLSHSLLFIVDLDTDTPTS